MPSARQLLSARNLDVVPSSVRIGLPSDESDELVYRVAMKGLLPPTTNYGVRDEDVALRVIASAYLLSSAGWR